MRFNGRDVAVGIAERSVYLSDAIKTRTALKYWFNHHVDGVVVHLWNWSADRDRDTCYGWRRAWRLGRDDWGANVDTAEGCEEAGFVTGVIVVFLRLPSALAWCAVSVIVNRTIIVVI